MKPPANEEEVIKPAVEGTLSVLRACAKSHTVKRVVFTSAGFVVGCYKVPTMTCPNFLVWMASLFDRSLKFVTPHLGVVNRLDNTKMREVLKIQPRDIRDTIIDTAYGLIEKGFVAKTSDYRGPGGPEERQRYRELRLVC
nr:hypothetical protein BaRGS_028802 [Batillaria attramentaria]